MQRHISSVWFITASSAELWSLDINILRKIWNLPRRCHAGILHCIGGVRSIYNVVIEHCSKLVYDEATTLVYTSAGYNSWCSARHWRYKVMQRNYVHSPSRM